MSKVEVLPRAVGMNLSVDVLVDGYVGTLLIPHNWQTKPRVDGITLDGQSFAITVCPGAQHIGPYDIRRLP